MVEMGLNREEPVYQRMARVLEAMIQSRAMRAGDRLPSVRQFSLQHRVSVPTAVQAYIMLAARGLIEARPKSGFYVCAGLADLTPEPFRPSTPKP